MAIVYPLSPPLDASYPSDIRLTLDTLTSVSVSPWTGSKIKYKYAREGWMLEVAFDPMPRDMAQPWIAFLAALRGRSGTFMFGPYGDVSGGVPLGTGNGTPLVKGAHSAGATSLITDGWAPNETVLKAADYFQIDQSLYMCLQDVTSDASGNATIDIAPFLKAHADNAPLILIDPEGKFELTDDLNPVFRLPRSQHFQVAFKAEEAQ